ncbi:Serine aminopeptidase S33 [Arabidopsis thaliana x Arabidopsis arenosa]|uniref:Serine aminopeptidase S33 n=1 Tax=Arabidopsis thaliana x Arabidopsis arenosa TaxID=1240361 RepID=A0A8T1YBS7_9BRAS|nr:Serine aminopeptidase S33 [Arabidopsis thaliana x Arabidopsis arenosa]
MEQLVNFIIRPPRAEYNPEHDLLEQEFLLKGRWYQRKDLEVKNIRGDILQCSHYMPVERPEDRPLPCVIYCHGNSGCRADASEAAIVLLPSNITIFTLDFSGSGLSGGEYVTLGWNEKDDLKAVVEYLRTDGNVSLIGLWGRSMGAVTSLMYGAEDPSIAAMVLDSPFSDLVDLMMELVDTYKFRLPKFTIKFAIQYMRRAVQKKANFNITDLNTIKVAKSCFVPVLFGHAIDDDFIQPHHSERIYEAYIGDKNIIKFEGDHNSPRPPFYFDSINIFFHNVLQPPEVVKPTFFDPVDDYFSKGSWNTMQELSSPQSSAQKSLAAGSTSDAINEVRLKRPMSRTEVPSNDPSNQSSSETKEKENNEVSSSSSSDMISFDLSNGDPYPPHLAVALDDDQFVEFHVDELADFPSNAEEEERMLMEAVMKSLKDMEVETHQNKEPSNTNTENTEGNAASSTTEQELAHSETAPASGPTPCNHDARSSSEASVPFKTSDSLPGPVNGFVPGASPKTSQSKNDVIDLSARTRATVTVVGRSSTSGNVLDGLLRRWDLNFFKGR